jgi:hypothetical protein
MASASISHVQIGAKEFGKSIDVADNPKAKLMYYLHSICSILDIDRTDANLKKMRAYWHHYKLTEEETDNLVLLCDAVSPDVLNDKCIFQSDELCGNYENEFIELKSVSKKLVVVESIAIAGQRTKVQKIMAYRKSWMRENYTDPMKKMAARLQAAQARMASATSRPKADKDCTIL